MPRFRETVCPLKKVTNSSPWSPPGITRTIVYCVGGYWELAPIIKLALFVYEFVLLVYEAANWSIWKIAIMKHVKKIKSTFVLGVSFFITVQDSARHISSIVLPWS